MKKIISFLIRLIVVFGLFSLPAVVGSWLIVPKITGFSAYVFMWIVGFCAILGGFAAIILFLIICAFLFSDEDLFDFVF